MRGKPIKKTPPNGLSMTGMASRGLSGLSSRDFLPCHGYPVAGFPIVGSALLEIASLA
jgi:hypothetical protein